MMRSNGMARRRNSRLVRATLITWVVLAATAASAAAQMSGDLRYLRGYELIPNPPTTYHPATLLLYGVFPTDCGAVEEASVIDSAHVKIRLHSQAQCDSAIANWSASFTLGMLTSGNHTVAIELTMDRPDSGVTVHQGSLTFGVEDSTVNPPPPPQPVFPLVSTTTTNPWPPTPTVPMALIVGGYTPFHCPVVSAASVTDTSHLAITLSPGPACGDTVGFWTHRFELGLQREGHHFMDLAITLEGDSMVTHHVPVGFLVVNDTTGWGPPPTDSLDRVLSPSRPNPFVNESRFSISLEVGGNAHVSVFDINGRRLSTVFRGRLEPGTTELAWNGRRDDGSRAAAGVYFYRLEMQGRVMARRLVLLRQ